MNVHFASELSLSPFGNGGDEWVVNAPFLVRVDARYIDVPTGFITDLESIPRWLLLARSFLSGRARRSAVVHDYLYTTKAGREYADDVFLAAMRAEGVHIAIRWLFFAAVHHFGGPIYDSKERQDESQCSVPADPRE